MAAGGEGLAGERPAWAILEQVSDSLLADLLTAMSIELAHRGVKGSKAVALAGRRVLRRFERHCDTHHKVSGRHGAGIASPRNLEER